MRNEPAPEKYLKMGYSPLHSQVLALFDLLKDEYHQCAMDNLYNSAKFARGCFLHPKKVLTIELLKRKAKVAARPARN